MKKVIITTTLGLLSIGGIAYSQMGGAITTEFSSISTIEAAQELYRTENGKYLQIIPGNKLASNEIGTVSEKLGKDVPSGYKIDEYVAPKGAGYAISWSDADGTHSTGYGPEAAERTWFIPKTIIKATSTPK